MIEKMDMKSMDITEENVKKIQALFPNAVTEVIVDGKITLKIDFDVLKQELSESLIEDKQERYQMTWPDKSKAKVLANSRITSTLRPDKEKSVDFDNTQNLYIEGDNLDVLKLLRETYLGKVKMIYIDPPYNTGNDFVYNDDFSQFADEYMETSGQYDEDGNRLVKNLESNGRFHTDWLNMIYPRLKLAKDLLSDDGVIFISIDDNEVENLKKVCNEIFGGANYEAEITYVRKTSGKQDSSNFAKSTEYILIYTKNGSWDCKTLIAGEQVTDRYNKLDKDGRKYRETDLRKTGNSDRREDRPLMFYPFYYNSQLDDLQVCMERDEVLLDKGYIEIYPIKPDGSEGRWRWGFASSQENIAFLQAKEMPKYKGKYTIYEIDYIDKNGDVRTVKEHTFWDRKEFNSDNAMLEFKALGFSNQLFPFPKSTALIKHMVYLSNFTDGIILDFFSGSATTAHAVMQLNAEDGGNRKFIMVQLPEECDEKSEAYKAGYKTICEIGEERIRRAGKKIKSENPTADKLDTGFRVLKLDSSNMQDVYYNPNAMRQSLLDETIDNVKTDRTPLDLLFQVMLDLGKDLSAKIEEKQVNGKTYFVVNGNDLIACFDEDIDNDVITEIAKQQPLYAVFKSTSFATDSASINNEQLFKTYSPATVIKVI